MALLLQRFQGDLQTRSSRHLQLIGTGLGIPTANRTHILMQLCARTGKLCDSARLMVVTVGCEGLSLRFRGYDEAMEPLPG